jgi:pimeloyl-ACP methyl ester carboxylesterase
MARVFVPGYGARPLFYERALGGSWLVHEPPAFDRRTHFAEHVDALARVLERLPEPVVLVGHSLGAATAVAVAARGGHRIEKLVLIAPAGLPLTKPIAQSVRELWAQARAGVYPSGELRKALRSFARAPFSAFRLAREVRSLDLRPELEAIRAAGIECEVVGCAGDTLTPLRHCRRIAELAGARFREIAATGGHMWPVIEPQAFATLL